MGRFCMIVLSLMCVTSTVASIVDPRGSRPVVPNTRSEKCATEKEWPFCTDDDWRSKCPSGCRIQGLMDQNDHSLMKRVEKIRNLLDQHRVKHRSTDDVSKQTYDYLREKLSLDADGDKSYLDLAQSLRQRITNMKIHIDRQLKILAALKDKVRDQVDDMRKLEVDIDIKLRTCKGSCKSYPHYSMEQSSYESLDKQVNQMTSQTTENFESLGTMYVMKSKLIKQEIVDSIYKSKDPAVGQQKEDIFLSVKNMQLVLETEGSKSSPATISKVPVCVRAGKQSRSGQHILKSCGRKSNFGLCTDDDWTFKCPSGCRLQGIISSMEEKSERKLRKTCQRAQVLEDAHEESVTTSHLLYNSIHLTLDSRHDSELKFFGLSGGLSQNLTRLRKKSVQLEQRLEKLHGRAKEQIEKLYRMEVDIDMKLRACSGSCRSCGSFSVDHNSFQSLVENLETVTVSDIRTPHNDVPHLTLQPTVNAHLWSSVQTQLLSQFKDIVLDQFVLSVQSGEEEMINDDYLE